MLDSEKKVELNLAVTWMVTHFFLHSQLNIVWTRPVWGMALGLGKGSVFLRRVQSREAFVESGLRARPKLIKVRPHHRKPRQSSLTVCRGS